MGGVHFVGEAIGSEAAAEVVTPARGNVESSSNLLILDISPGDRKHLSAKTKFTKFTCHRIALELVIMGLDGGAISLNQSRLANSTTRHMHEAECSILIFHGELPLGTHWNIIDFTGWEIGHIGLIASAEPVAFLRFLLASLHHEREPPNTQKKVEFDPIGPGHSLTKLFCFDTYIIVVNSQSGAQDDVINPVEGRTTETMLLR